MFSCALTLAVAVCLSMGGDGSSLSTAPAAEAPARVLVQPSPAAVARPGFTLGAGDALGVRIRVNDTILARRLEAERTRFATVPTQE